MKLEDYLKAIKECPDEMVRYKSNGEKRLGHRLSVEFGIDSHFAIYLKADYVGIIRYLNKSGQYLEYKPDKSIPRDAYGPQLFANLAETIILPTMSMDPAIKIYVGYTAAISLRPEKQRRIDGIAWQRLMADEVYKLGQFILDENIPILMPDTIGRNYRGKHAESLIVVHEPENQIKSPYLRIKEHKI